MESTHPKTGPRDFFLYVLAIGTLYMCVWRYIDLLFEYVDYLVPDRIEQAANNWYFRGMTDSVKWSISSLAIVFPVYLFTTWYLRRDAIANPEKRDLRVRKWLLNFTLFLAVVTILADLVTLLNHFLDGDLTARFVLKVFAVLVVAGGVLGYYLWDLRRETVPSSKPSRNLAAAASIIMLMSIAAGFFIIGSPGAQRKMRFDETRVQDLQNIQWEVVNYWQNKGKLPPALADLRNDINGFVAPEDPSGVSGYEYWASGPKTFELCAGFDLPSSALENGTMETKPRPLGAEWNDSNWNWKHPAGRFCWSRMIDPDFYPPFDKRPK